MIRQPFLAAVFAAAISSAGAAAKAQSAPAAEPNATDLAKTTQNPVGDIVSIPFQFNFNNGGAYQDQTFFNLNFQPVIPIHLNNKVTLISRTIVPINSIPTGDGTSSSGVGDINQQTYFTPARPHKVIVGVGPSFSFPTATASPAKTGTWGGGFAAVLLSMPGPWVIGSLFQQIWPMSDSGGAPRTNAFLWQYFINYNFGKGWALATAPSMTANWDAASGQKWTVPVGGGISRTLVFQKQPMTLGFQYYYNAMRPDTASSTTVRFIFALIYPQKR
ncbi:neuromedin U [Edaphobacter sp. HDX4]|uniref:neuromedin U n=1 Tax=Edaphobacter sp. HDX4 TaxID=2794064 RepID=UPI002FE526B0